MTDKLAAVGLRILAPRAVALGEGDGDALQNVDTTKLPDGALAFCSDVRQYYSFFRDGALPANGTTVIVPASGPGEWIAILGGVAGESVAYQIAMSSSSPPNIAVPTNWSAIPNDATWIDTDSALGAGTLTPPALWSVTGTGSGVLTFNGPSGTRLLFTADVSLSHASSIGETLWGIYISQNGAHLGTGDNLAREQQSSQVTAAAGTPEHLHTESLLTAQQGDFFQILVIDRGTQATLVNRAQLSVRGA